MEENKSVITNEFDRSGRYDAGLKALAKSLRVAFLLLLIGIIGTLIYFVSGAGYFSVEPQEAVIVTRFGKIVGTYTSGGHWFMPFPVSQFIRVQTSQQLLEIDFAAAAAGNPEQVSESLEPGRDNYIITGDANIIHSSWTVAYRVNDPEKYYLNLLTPQLPVVNGKVMPDDEFTDADGMVGTRGPVTFLRNLFRQAVISVTARCKVDDILTKDQNKYSEEVYAEFSRMVAAHDCGLEIINVGLNRIYPPANTKAAFEEVTAADNASAAMIKEAETYAEIQKNDAAAKSVAIKAAAEIYKKRVIAKLNAQMTYFENIRKQNNNGALVMALYTDMLREIAPGISSDKFVLGPQGQGKTLWLKLNPEPKTSAAANGAEEGK